MRKGMYGRERGYGGPERAIQGRKDRSIRGNSEWGRRDRDGETPETRWEGHHTQGDRDRQRAFSNDNWGQNWGADNWDATSWDDRMGQLQAFRDSWGDWRDQRPERSADVERPDWGQSIMDWRDQRPELPDVLNFLRNMRWGGR
jgi:hypothetical protein